MRTLMITRVQHSLREENTLVDYFTNLAFKFCKVITDEGYVEPTCVENRSHPRRRSLKVEI
ncbi:hypothetical protein H5410_037220 [Solanum commersonii]|uniref:Uncharacterized protein n=1 Tax=Solanum commersonii TaxID=4109 RepID=A0A9J5Y9L4_SOLCO|nr:hypothetical protein H5410_037220 [Solanum commersonii]